MDTVLVIDDDKLFLATVREELERAGFRFLGAETAAQAKEVLAKEAVQVMLLDVILPDADGLDLLPQLREAHPQVPVIVASARASYLSGIQAMRRGAADFLRKPMNFEELVTSLQVAIRKVPAAGAAPAQSEELIRLQDGSQALMNLIRWDNLGTFHAKPDAWYQRVIEMASTILDVEIVSLMLLGDDGLLRIAQAKGLDPEIQRTTTVPLGEGISGHVAESGEPLLIRNLSQDMTFGKKERNPRYRTDSLVSVPLKVNGKTVGVLNANNKANGGSFTEHDLSVMVALSALVSLAMTSSSLYEQLTRSVEELAIANAKLARVNLEKSRSQELGPPRSRTQDLGEPRTR
ncbi:MAG TPA: response regulator [Candidatus Baltobacteraceae bacterium]|nr:response regulator [Candidatus Baltobacteraceae bacterium]